MLAFLPLDPATHPPVKVYFSASVANCESTVDYHIDYQHYLGNTSWSVAHLSLSELGTAQPKLVRIYSFVFYKHWLQLFLQLISKNGPSLHFPAFAHFGQLLLLSFSSFPEKNKYNSFILLFSSNILEHWLQLFLQ